MLNIARNIYACWDQARAKSDELSEAEIIPIGESTNEKRKIDNAVKKFSSIFEHENIPLPGFTLFASNRKKWGSLDQTWLVIDPRGFLVRITNENLESILHVTGITEGLIQEKCVWARDDTQTKMSLVPVSSPIYIDALRNTELIEGKVDMKEVQIGDTVLLQNTLSGKYMGVLSLYGPLNNYSVQEEYKAQVYLRREVIEVSPGKYHYQTDLKILKILQKAATPSTREESVLSMNAEIKKGTSFFSSNMNMSGTYFGTHGLIKHVSISALPKLRLTFEEVDKIEATKIFYEAQTLSDFSMLMIENAQGKFMIDFPANFSPTPCTIQSFTVMQLANIVEPAEKLILKDSRRSYYGNNKSLPKYALDNFTKFYKIVKHVKDDTYI